MWTLQSVDKNYVFFACNISLLIRSKCVVILKNYYNLIKYLVFTRYGLYVNAVRRTECIFKVGKITNCAMTRVGTQWKRNYLPRDCKKTNEWIIFLASDNFNLRDFYIWCCFLNYSVFKKYMHIIMYIILCIR